MSRWCWLCILVTGCATTGTKDAVYAHHYERLGAADANARRDAIEWFVNADEGAVAYLSEAVVEGSQEPDGYRRTLMAIWVVTELGPRARAVSPALLTLLRERYHERHARAIADAWVAIGPGALPELEEALFDSRGRVSDVALKALRRLGTAALPPLQRAVGGPYRTLAENAASALRAVMVEVSDESSRAEVLEFVREELEHDPNAAARAIVDFAVTPTKLCAAPDRTDRLARVHRALTDEGRSDVDFLATLLDSSDRRTRAFALLRLEEALAQGRHPERVSSLLVTALDDSDASVQDLALAALLHGSGPLPEPALPALRDALAPGGSLSGIPTIRLKELDEGAFTFLIRSVSDETLEVGHRVSLTRALSGSLEPSSELGSTFEAAVLNLSVDSQPRLRAVAAVSLGRIDQLIRGTQSWPRHEERLFRLADDSEPIVRTEALRALASYLNPRPRELKHHGSVPELDTHGPAPRVPFDPSQCEKPERLETRIMCRVLAARDDSSAGVRAVVDQLLEASAYAILDPQSQK